MLIEAQLDEMHAEKLFNLQKKLNQPIDVILANAIDLFNVNHSSLSDIDLAQNNKKKSMTSYEALEEIGFDGCIESDANNLDDLINAISSENCHKEFDFGVSQGREIIEW